MNARAQRIPVRPPYGGAVRTLEAIGNKDREPVRGNRTFVEKAEMNAKTPAPFSATRNWSIPDPATIRVRDFSFSFVGGIPTFVDTPFAGRLGVVACNREEQGLVATAPVRRPIPVPLCRWSGN